MAYPLCPFCYEGEIVEENDIKGNYFCNRCFRKVDIRKKKNSFVKHL
ncbi:hypothetical protein KY343_04805 [Candidatus Woesearchaeota archaeon]|nr:hypothetical protein [Candidatus Woesearchaeota archaeon]